MENVNLIEELIKAAHRYDYHPAGGNLIYKAQEYFDAKKKGLPTTGIKVVEIIPNEKGNGFIYKECGIIKETEPEKVSWYDEE